MSAWAKDRYEEVMATQPSAQQMSWYSAKQGIQFGDTQENAYVIHPTYPSITVLVGPMVGGPANEGYSEILAAPTHDGSTLVAYINSSLAPSAKGDIDYRMKRTDKLVNGDGVIFYVTSVDNSTTDVKLVIGLQRKAPEDENAA